MKAEGIRIGNLLSKNGNVIKVKGISRHCGDYAINTEDSWVYLKNCEPIKLTEKWLLKFGFIKDSVHLYYSLGQFIIRHDFVLCDIDIRVEIKHVHQLQNLYFALRGEELILKQ